MVQTTNVKPGDLNYDHYAMEVYDEDIRHSIPGHDELHKKIEEIVEGYAKNYEVKKILDLGTGTGITLEKMLHFVPKTYFVAMDFSAQMLAGAKKHLAAYIGEYIFGDYANIPLGTDFDIVVSVIGMHHQTHEGKQKMFQKVFDSLSSGGVFIFGDLMTYRDPQKAALNDAYHYHHLVENARNEKSLQEWAHHHKFLNQLASLEDHVDWLRAVGFTRLSVEITLFNTVLVLSYKS